jgi:LPXTG-site transpeptidase (sortase) family protein
MSRKEAIKFVLVRSLGNFLLLMSIYGVLATFGPALYFEVQYQVIKARGVRFEVRKGTEVTKTSEASNSAVVEPSQPRNEVNFASILAGSKEQVLVPKDTTFSIVIPKIGATAKVYPNVDPANPSEFLPVLKKGVAHAKGSVFPGMPGSTYLFAHSADNWWDVGLYNAVFYLLKDLQKGDEVVVFFENQRIEYVVSEVFITDPSDVSLLEQAKDPSRTQLVLQTCWPPGTTLKRQFVIAVPKKS